MQIQLLSCQDCLFIICLLPAGKAFPAAIMPVLTRQGKYSSGERGMPVSSICVLADKDIEKLDGKERFSSRYPAWEKNPAPGGMNLAC